MLPLLVIAAGAGAYAWYKRKRPAPAKPVSPAAAQVHGALMGQEFNPAKLEQAAKLFQEKGLSAQARDLNGKAAQVRKQCQVAAELVEAARSADQNAMGMIAAIREQASQGNPRAIVSANFIARYCMANPPKELGPLGETPMLPPQAQANDPAPGWVPARAG